MRIAFVVSVWLFVGLALLGFVGLGLSLAIALPIGGGVFAIGLFLLRLPEKPRHVLNSENGLLFLGSSLGFGLLVAPLFVGRSTLYGNMVGGTILACIALGVTFLGVRIRWMLPVAAGMWAVVLCLWLQMLYVM